MYSYTCVHLKNNSIFFKLNLLPQLTALLIITVDRIQPDGTHLFTRPNNVQSDTCNIMFKYKL